MKIYGYSKALFANWIYVEPLRLLLDAGEGVNNILEGHLLGVHDLLLSHGHTDHFTGLHSLLMLRRREIVERGQSLPRLQVYYPAGSQTLSLYLEYLARAISPWEDLVALHPMEPGSQSRLQGREDLQVSAFAMEHMSQEACLGYRVSQLRRKLRPELHGLSGEELSQLRKRGGEEALSVEQEHPLVTYSGDGRPMQDEASQGVELLIHEATFLEAGQSTEHSTLAEAIDVFTTLDAKRLLLCHFSSRYTAEEITAALDALVPDSHTRDKIDLLLPGEPFTRNLPIAVLP